MRILSWNIARRPSCWQYLADDPNLDVALLQEAVPPPPEVQVETYPSTGEPWVTAGKNRRFCAAVARVSDRVHLRGTPMRPISRAGRAELGVSLQGTIAACEVAEGSNDPITVVSAYGAWENPLGDKNGWIYADAAVHRLISDLSALIARQRGHRIIVAGDFNVLHGYGEHGSPYWGERYRTVFDRMDALGLPLVGPAFPNGIQADPWPTELPSDSTDVPTYRTRQNDPASAARQLDFVFASAGIAPDIEVRAVNGADAWGPTDHCRLEISI